MRTEEESIVAVAHFVAIESPFPLDAEVLAAAFEGTTAEHVGELVGASCDGGPPPVVSGVVSTAIIKVVPVSGEIVFVVVGVKVHVEADLAEVVEAVDALAFFFGFGEGGQEHAGQNGDDGDYHQQFDEGEGQSFASLGRVCRFHDVEDILVCR